MEHELKDLISYAIKAPSGHNTQPWKFKVNENEIVILPDYERSLPVVDPDNHALFISLGCALENLLIAARHFSYQTSLKMSLESEGNERITVNLSPSLISGNNILFENISRRQSTRNRYNAKPIPAGDLDKLKEASPQEDVRCLILTRKEEIEPITQLIKEAAVLQFKNKAFVEELIQWIRFSSSDGMKTSDGLHSGTTGNPSVPKWFGRLIMKTTLSANRETKKIDEFIHSSSGLIIFVARRNDKKAWINVGRSFERVALTATSLNINIAHENMPCEEISVRQKLITHLNLNEGEHPLLVVRIGYSQRMPYSYRRPLEEVLVKK